MNNPAIFIFIGFVFFYAVVQVYAHYHPITKAETRHLFAFNVAYAMYLGFVLSLFVPLLPKLQVIPTISVPSTAPVVKLTPIL